MSRSTRVLRAAAFVAMISVPAAADCVEPSQAPIIPDGATATAEQIKATHAAVQSYVNLLQSYQDCLEARIKLAPKTTKPEELQKMRDQGNAAIDEATALSASYSAAVKAFKARTAK